MADVHALLNERLKRQGVDPDDLASVLASEFADEVMATRFSERHGDTLAYVATWGRWLIWRGDRWHIDETLDVVSRVRVFVQETASTLGEGKSVDRLRSKILSKKSIDAIEQLARADRRHARSPDVWDADPWALNTPGGGVDLRTGEIRAHRPQDLQMKCAGAAQGGDAPLWRAFLRRVFGGDEELIAFVQRMVGYALTGAIHEHALFFLLGDGANGKSVFLNTIRHVLGDYAVVAPENFLVASTFERHSTDLAMLRGARLAVGHETERGHRWATARVKALTAGDPITARFMRKDNFTFTPQFKMVVAGNHFPQIDAIDEAFRRRLYIVPFDVTILEQERDLTLPQKLRAEASGILAWALVGCRSWQEIGLAPPVAVNDATNAVLRASDALGRFLDERCDLGDPNAIVELRDLFEAWRSWCAARQEPHGDSRGLADQLRRRGYNPSKHSEHRRIVFHGVKLKPAADAGSKDPKDPLD